MGFRYKDIRTCAKVLGILLCIAGLLFFAERADAATMPVTAKIPVTCEGGNPLETFVFVMDMESKEMQTPDQLMIRMKAGEEGAFTIHYVYPGTYHYQIRQEAGSDWKTTYDSAVYDVDVYVTEDESGVLSAEPVVFKKGSDEKKAAVDFHNKAASSPSKNSHTSSGSSYVQTGDRAEISLYIGMLFASLATLVLLVKVISRKKRG